MLPWCRAVLSDEVQPDGWQQSGSGLSSAVHPPCWHDMSVPKLAESIGEIGMNSVPTPQHTLSERRRVRDSNSGNAGQFACFSSVS